MTIEILPSRASPVFHAPARPRRAAFPRRLREVVSRLMPDHPDAVALVGEFLRIERGFDARFIERLIDVGRGLRREQWPLRLLAGRMLEHQILALAPDDVAAHRNVFEALAIDFDAREGFTATSDAQRIAQFRARLSRYAHVHDPIDGTNTTAAALERFIRSARRPCRVPVARYLFAPEETLDRIYGNTRQSRGMPDSESAAPAVANRALVEFPPREQEIARALLSTSEIFWVGDWTPSEMNALVEYPLGTVALVVKPPGSDVEIELKRAGMRGPRAWDVVYSRNGHVVCSTHHLQGGAGGKLLEWQTHAEARFAAIWRAVHGKEAPISRTLRVNNVFTLPLDGGGHASVLQYFTDPSLYGPGYPHMRRAMAQALDNLLRFDGQPPFEAQNDVALTGRFLGAVRPGQALQIGTSSFRLDRIGRYLRPDGARGYFSELGRTCTLDDEIAFADELLDEILVGYVPPAKRARTYTGHLRAAFAVPRNRARADRSFFECAEQFGTMFGTSVALCIGSGGESYVTRNVGLRNVFEDGAWKLRMIFMDHDALNIPAHSDRDVLPQVAARGMWFDYVHIAGGTIAPARVRGSLRLLAGIYRVSPAVRRAGMAAFHRAVERAYRATRDAVPTRLKSFFHPKWIERLEDFDEAVRSFLEAGRATRRWSDSIPSLLGARRQTTRAMISQYIRGIGAFGQLWRKMPYLLHRKGD